MDFEFTPEQNALRESTARWVARAYPFSRRRKIAAVDGFDRSAYAELAALGLTALRVPVDYDGLGLSPVDGMVVMEELGRGLILEPLSPTAWIASECLTHAPQPLRREWLPRVASGEALLAFAHEERNSRYSGKVWSQAAAHGANFSVTGTKAVVPIGDRVDAFLVSACIPACTGGPGLFLVKHIAPGVRALGYSTQDGGRAAEVVFSEAPATLVADSTIGSDAIAAAIAGGIAALCAEAVGVMDALFAMTIDHLKIRQQFGAPLASFQALRHRMADCKMALELARSMSYYAHLMLQEGALVRDQAVAQAKVQVGQSARFVGEQAIQLHGGTGVTDAHAASHYFRRLTCIDLSLGDSLHHLGQVARRMDFTAGVLR